MDTQIRESQDHIKAMAPIISRAYQLGKQQRHDDAFNTLLPYFERDEVPQYFCQPAGWTIYRYFKDHIAQLSPLYATTILGYYLMFCAHKPDLVHSYIMILAINYHKLHQNEFKITEFCLQWGLGNFMTDDYKSKSCISSDGKAITFPSLAAKVATAIYKELKSNHSEEKTRSVLPFFETVKTRCPKYEFTPLYIANLYAWIGDYDHAKMNFKNLLLKSSKWYLWQALGNLLDDQYKLSCYCKALSIGPKEDYAGELHLSLARMLVNDDKPHAATEIEKYTKTYRHNGWTLHKDAYELEKLLKDIPHDSENIAFYENNSSLAEEFVYQDAPQDEFVYAGNKTNKRGKTVASLKLTKRHIEVNGQMLTTCVPIAALPPKTSVGDVLMCRYSKNGQHINIMTMHATNRHISVGSNSKSTSIAESKEGIGTVRQHNGQIFAFIDNCFVSPRICQSMKIHNGQRVKFTAKLQADGRYKVVKITII